MRLTAIIEREGSGYVSLCPELDIASQGETVEQARENLREALGLFFECAPAEEIKARLKSELYVTQVEIAVGKLRVLSGRQVCIILERHGFREVRRRGSHVVMQRIAEDGAVTIPIPDHA